MSQIYPLDYIIRRVDSDNIDLTSSQKIIIVGNKSKKVFPRKPIWQDVRYYLVATTKDSRNVAECHGSMIPIKEFESDRSIGIRTYYQASCRPGNEEKVVLALYGNSHPGEELNNLINQWIIDYTRNKEAFFFDNYNSERGKLQNYIADRAFHEVGLDLKVRISLDGEEKLQSIIFESLFIPVRVQDHDKELDLKVSATLNVDKNYKIKALFRKWVLSDIENLFQEKIKEYIYSKLLLEQFYNELHNGELKKNLSLILNKLFNDFVGYKLEHFSIEHSVSSDPSIQDFFEKEYAVECNVQEYPKPIVINNKLQMNLEDIGKYKSCQCPNLDRWAEENLQRIIHESLFASRYIDLLINFQPKEQEIKRLLNEKASNIGYRIKYLLTFPDIEYRKLREKFTIESENVFTTKFSNVKVKLQIFVTARINNLKSVEKHLNRQEDVIAIMRDGFIDEARQLLHTIDPEIFYMDFHHSREEGEPSVERKLIHLIASYLEHNFGAEVINVNPKVIDTELMERFRKLQGQLCRFEAEIKSLHIGEPVKFWGTFQVEGVDKNGWHKFQIREYTIEEIRTYIVENIHVVLGTQQKEVLMYNTLNHLKQLTEEINNYARLKVREVFGLEIGITTFHRDRTKEEEMLSEIDELSDREEISELKTQLLTLEQERKVESEKDAIIEKAEKEQLEELLERRKKLILMEVISEDAIKEVDEKIRQLKGIRHSSSKQQIDKKLKHLKKLKQQSSTKQIGFSNSSNLLTKGNEKDSSDSAPGKEKMNG